MIGLSIDPVDDHKRWAKDIEETQGTAPNYPIIGDADLEVAKLYDMIHPNATGGKRTAADNATMRSVFVVGPDKKVKLILTYPMSTGRNFDEVLRVLDSIQLTAKHKVATPVNWKPGEDVIIAGGRLRRGGEAEVPRGAGRRPGRTCGSWPSRSSGRSARRRFQGSGAGTGRPETVPGDDGAGSLVAEVRPVA